jgi:hypothetical protein
LRAVSGSMPEQGGDEHGLQRQRRQRKTGARGGRISDGDIVKHEE